MFRNIIPPTPVIGNVDVFIFLNCCHIVDTIELKVSLVYVLVAR